MSDGVAESVSYPAVVLVTGAAGGMGANHARALAARGTHVCLADIHDPSEVVEQIEQPVVPRRRTRSTCPTLRHGRGSSTRSAPSEENSAD